MINVKVEFMCPNCFNILFASSPQNFHNLPDKIQYIKN